LRIALVGPVYPYRGGIPHYTTMLYRAFRGRENDVLLVSFKRQYPQWLYPGRSDKDPSKSALKVEDARYWIDSVNPITWFTTFRRISRYNPDIIVLQWWTPFFAPVWFVIGVLNRLMLKKPLVYVCHNVLPHESRWWYSWATRAVLVWGMGFTVSSQEEETRLKTLMPRAKVVLAPHPPYTMFVADRLSRYEARRRLDLDQEAKVLLFFGIVREYKGLKNLLLAMPTIRERVDRVVLLVVGEFWDRKQPYVDMVKSLGIGDAVIIEDRYVPNEEVALYFSAADLLVAPYTRVTGSGVVQMAEGFGLPAVTTVLASESCAGNGPTHIVVSLSDVGELQDAISSFFGDSWTSDRGAPVSCAKDSGAWNCVVDAVLRVCESHRISVGEKNW